MRQLVRQFALPLFVFVGLTSLALCQRFSTGITRPYRITPNITYLKADNFEAKLDVYMRSDINGRVPTVLFFHGGGWVEGSKEAVAFDLIPYFEMGWNVVNVEYRLAPVALAPAAVEDGLCALRWVIRNAQQYGIDTARIVLSGRSAGGHLALTTGMIPATAGLDRQCPGNEELKVAAIVNWFGITDVADLLDGMNMKPYAVQWIGSMPNRFEIAKQVSPMTYARPGLPPIISIHGNADSTVPYSHSVRLNDALKKLGIDSELVTISGGEHGGFTRVETQRAYDAIKAFLGRHGLLPVTLSN